MGDYSYKQGVEAGRDGSEPNPPKYGLADIIVGNSEKDIEKCSEDYKRGYAAGSSQRVADEMHEDE